MMTPQNNTFVLPLHSENSCMRRAFYDTAQLATEVSTACRNAISHGDYLQTQQLNLLHIVPAVTSASTESSCGDSLMEMVKMFECRRYIVETVKMLWADEPHWDEAARKIWDFRGLPEGWDSYGGERISSLTCYNAVLLMATWYRQSERIGGDLAAPIVSPCGNGSIQMDWRQGRKSLELEATAEEETPYRWYSPSHDKEDDFVEPDEEESTQLLRWLITQK